MRRRSAGRCRSAGFTLPELIAVLVIAGLIAAFAASRLDSGSGIDELGFRERTMTALRLAQRRAQADGCDVRVTIATGGYQLAQRAALCSGAFSLSLAGTAGAGSTLDSTPPAGITLSSTPATFYYDAAGAVRSAPGGSYTNVTITVGSQTIQIVGTTGHASI
jgi:MSHA pilin protein MshC